jgi:hypothetical protein
MAGTRACRSCSVASAAVRAALYAGFPNEAPKIEGGGPTMRAVGGA